MTVVSIFVKRDRTLNETKMSYQSLHFVPAVRLILFINLTYKSCFAGQVMEVTRSNFRSLQPQIEREIKNAAFLSIDGEFTGLHNGSSAHAYDTPAEYYAKLRQGSMDFLFFQFGLATFSYDHTLKKYMHKAYNFYVFPKPLNRDAKDHRFLCQSSCMDFLAEHGFDFNKVFKEGIPYMSEPDETHARNMLLERRKRILLVQNESVPIPEEYKACVENACLQIQHLLKSPEIEREIVLLKKNRFAKKLVYQEVKSRFTDDGVVLDQRHSMMLARKGVGVEQRTREIALRHEMEDQEVTNAVGFSHVIRTIAQSGKLVIGHNLLLDICHIFRQFFMPLPEDYEEFKSTLHCLFPRLLDTKYMSATEPFKSLLPSSALVNLLPALKMEPFSMPDVGCAEEGCGYTSIHSKHHEAGYDAFLTGISFLALGNYLLKSINETDAILADHSCLTPYVNKLFLMKVYDTYINLCGADPPLDRDHVFYVTFPRDWRFSNIAELFKSVGGIYVHWTTDDSAWVALQDKFLFEGVKSINTDNFENVTITPYSEYKEQERLEQFSTLTNTPTSSHQIFASPDTKAAVKKRKLEQSAANQGGNNKRRRRRSQGRESFSKRSFETIPEELEEVESPAKKKALNLKDREFGKSATKPIAKEFDEDDTWD